MTGTGRPGRLPCGARPDDLLAQVAEGRAGAPDAHQSVCPHCRALLDEYARRWAPHRELAATRVDPPPDLLAHTLARLAGGRGGGRIGRVDDEAGPYGVAERAVVTVAGLAARTTPGVRTALCRPGPWSGVEVTVAADYGPDLHRLADRIRARVAAAVSTTLGLRTVEVAVAIDDVLPPR